MTLLSHEFSSSNEITNSNESARNLHLFFIFRSNLYWTINLRPVIFIAFKILCSTFKTEALSFHTVEQYEATINFKSSIINFYCFIETFMLYFIQVTHSILISYRRFLSLSFCRLPRLSFSVEVESCLRRENVMIEIWLTKISN